jgi:uncharacterized protein YecE (DUF72 family)
MLDEGWMTYKCSRPLPAVGAHLAPPTSMATCRIGCAGWTIPKAHHSEFPAEGSHLARYAARFSAVEINSSFYRQHQPATYARWADSVPADFRFSAKIPRAITHDQRLVAADVLLEVFLSEVTCLGAKLGCLLVQLPPSLAYDRQNAESFLADLRAQYGGPVVIEPRHPSWFTRKVEAQLRAHRVGQVAADPACVSAAAEPAGWMELIYIRLHGSPEIYYSAYDEAYLDRLAERMRSFATRADEVWCIFDNTSRAAATPNAIALSARL